MKQFLKYTTHEHYKCAHGFTEKNYTGMVIQVPKTKIEAHSSETRYIALPIGVSNVKSSLVLSSLQSGDESGFGVGAD